MIIVFALMLLISSATYCMEKVVPDFDARINIIQLYGNPVTRITSSSSGDIIAYTQDMKKVSCIRSFEKKYITELVDVDPESGDLKTFDFCGEKFASISNLDGEISLGLFDMHNHHWERIRVGESLCIFFNSDENCIYLLEQEVRKAVWSPQRKDLFLAVCQDDTLAEWSCVNIDHSQTVIAQYVKDADYNKDGTLIFAFTKENQFIVFDALNKECLKKIMFDKFQFMNTLYGIGTKKAYLGGTSNIIGLVDIEQDEACEAVDCRQFSQLSTITASHFNRKAGLIVLAGINKRLGMPDMYIVR